MPVLVLIAFNPVSGRGRAARAAAALADGLRRAGIACRTIATERAPASEWLRPELAGARALVVAGGDGAVRSVALEAARANVPIWHAPLGTENLFARHFGMTAEPAEVAAAIERGATVEMDLGLATAGTQGDPSHPSSATRSSMTFAIMASVGFDAAVVHALARRRAGAITHASYLPALLECLGRWEPPELGWTIDGETERLGRGMVVLGNLPEYGIRLNPTPDARRDDGALDAVFLPADSGWAALAWIPILRLGAQRAHPAVRFRRGARIEVLADSPVVLQLDGDAAGPAEGARSLRLEVAPQRLTVLSLPR